MQALFTHLTQAVEGAPAIALGAAFVWGILSVLLSPCHLSSIPLIVAFVGEQGKVGSRRALTISTVFALGILVTIAAIGVATASMGRILGDTGRYGSYFVAATLFLVGLYLLDVLPMSWSGRVRTGVTRKGVLAAFVLGAAYGIALGPCTFAYMAPMLAVTYKMGHATWLFGATLLLAYGIGHCSVIAFAGASMGTVQNYLDWNETSGAIGVVKKICGVLVLLGGLYLLYSAQ